MRFIVLLDACVLYPAPLRDFFLHLATTGLFAAKWTDQIHDEWISSLLRKRPELKIQLTRTRQLLNEAVPDCLVTGYEPLIDSFDLPDKDDRHVVAAAVRCNAQIIVTFNLKHFPIEALEAYDIEPMHPDAFVEHQYSLQQNQVIGAAKRHRQSLKRPPKSVDEYLDTLAANKLVITADILREFKDLI